MSSLGECELTSGSYVVGKVRALSIYPAAAAYPCINIRLSCSLLNSPEARHLGDTGLINYRMHDLTGELRLTEYADSIGPIRWTGDRQGSPRSSDKGYESQLDVVCDLDLVRLEVIETHRDGRAPKLWLQLWPTFVQESRWIDASVRSFALDIPRDDWLTCLTSLHRGRSEIIEVRFESSEAEFFNRALSHTAESRNRILLGDYNQAVAACRLAIDEMFSTLNAERAEFQSRENGEAGRQPPGPETFASSSLRAVLGQHTDEARSAEYRRILKGLKDLTHLPHHISSGTRSYSRAEAQFIVRTTENFLAMVGALAARSG